MRSHGAVCNGTFDSGLYHVDGDGTGYIAVNFDTSDPGCFSIVFDVSIALSGNGERADIANDENDSMIGTLIQQTKSGFSNSDFNGSYALGVSGPSSLVLASEPRTVGTGVMVSDGAGNISGQRDASRQAGNASSNGNLDPALRYLAPTAPVMWLTISPAMPEYSDGVANIDVAGCPARASMPMRDNMNLRHAGHADAATSNPHQHQLRLRFPTAAPLPTIDMTSASIIHRFRSSDGVIPRMSSQSESEREYGCFAALGHSLRQTATSRWKMVIQNGHCLAH